MYGIPILRRHAAKLEPVHPPPNVEKKHGTGSQEDMKEQKIWYGHERRWKPSPNKQLAWARKEGKLQIANAPVPGLDKPLSSFLPSPSFVNQAVCKK